MAPASLRDLEDDSIAGESVPSTSKSTKPTLYLLDTFHPVAVKHAQKLFHCVLPAEFESSWRQNAQYLLIKSSCFTESDVNSCTNLLAIGKQGVGIDRINAAACAKRNIPIFNTPGVNAQAVAELVLSLTMSVARQVPYLYREQLRGERLFKEKCSGLLMHQKTVAVLGMGNIGKLVARMFRGAFDSEIIAYDPYMPDDCWADIPHTRARSLEEILPRADVLTLHVPLVDSTRGMIGFEELSKMKRTAIIINAARGGIVDENGLSEALKKGLVWGAGLDCHEEEPPTLRRYEDLWSNANVVSTPHIGAATSQTQMESAVAAINRVYEFSRGRGDIQK